MTYTTRVSKEGRVLIPAELRNALGLTADTVVAVYEMDGEVRIAPHALALRRLQQRMAKYRKPGVSVVDELIAERRAEAERE